MSVPIPTLKTMGGPRDGGLSPDTGDMYTQRHMYLDRYYHVWYRDELSHAEARYIYGGLQHV